MRTHTTARSSDSGLEHEDGAMARKLSLVTATLAVLVLTGSARLAAQQPAAERPAPQALVMLATNITAQQDSAAGQPRPDSLRALSRPGDVLEYLLVFTNTQSAEVRNVVVGNPIPSGLAYVANTAGASRADVQVEFSIDRGESWSERPEIEVVDENGQTVRRPAPPEMYTNVRWTITGGVAPGTRVEARYRTVVGGVGTPAGEAGGSR